MSDKIYDKIYDVIILGGGPAGLSAAIYARRAKLDVLLIEKGELGGEILKTPRVDNYPGGIIGESGSELIERLAKQADSFDYVRATDEIQSVNIEGEVKVLSGPAGSYKGKTVIICTGHGPGSIPKPLGIKGEEQFVGRGVSYCATCDAPFFSGLDIIAVCEDTHALEEALYLVDFGRKVTIITGKSSLIGPKDLVEKAKDAENVDIILNTNLTEIKGEEMTEKIILENNKTGESTEIQAKKEDGVLGIFIFAGNFPQTKMLEGVIDMEDGYIITDENMATNISGVFAAGDVRKKTLRQIVTATADGAIAAVEAKKMVK